MWIKLLSLFGASFIGLCVFILILKWGTNKKKVIGSDFLVLFSYPFIGVYLYYLLHNKQGIFHYDTLNLIGFKKFNVILLLVTLVFSVLYGLFIKRIRKEQPKRMSVLTTIFALLLFLAIVLFYSAHWVEYTFGLLTPEQVIFHLKVPLTGSDSDFIYDFYLFVLLKSMILAATLNAGFASLYRWGTNWKKLAQHKRLWHTVVNLALLLSTVGLVFGAAKEIKAKDYYNYFTNDSKLIQKEYVKPTSQNVTFPKVKRNLIYIYVESLESTLISKELGGQWDTNILQPLTDFTSKYGVHFSNSSSEYGGANQYAGTGWTVAGIVSQSSGVPLKVPINGNSYGTASSGFLPGITTIGDILAKQGYNQMFMAGSDATFGGRKTFFKNHGNYQIYDLATARKEKKIPSDYYTFWGFEDSKLYTYAKEQITKLSNDTEPFNFTMLTENTHHMDGYIEKTNPKKYGDSYTNAYAYSSEQLAEFLTWIMAQPFYENTTVVLSGDHLSMNSAYFKNVSESKRTTYNLILNPATTVKQSRLKNRSFATFDLFPTTLAAMGVDIKGNRLGIGTNLFSDEETLAEKYGTKKLDSELEQSSTFYNNTFLSK